MLALPQCFNRMPAATLQLLAQCDRLRSIEQQLKQNPRIPAEGFRALAIRPADTKGLLGLNPVGSSDCLTLLADSPMDATRLKNLKPTLLAQLKNMDVADIIIKIRSANPHLSNINAAMPTIAARPIPESVAVKLRQIAPNTPLAATLHNMLDQALIVKS